MAESDDSATPAGAPSAKRHVVSQIEEGMAMARRGDRAGARAIFQSVIHNNPHQEDAWLWLAWVAEDSAKSLAYLREAEALLPPSDRLEQAIAWAEQSAWLGKAKPTSARAETAKTARAKALQTHIAVDAADASVSPAGQVGHSAIRPNPTTASSTARNARVWTKLPENTEQERFPSEQKGAASSHARIPTLSRSAGQKASQAWRSVAQDTARISQKLQSRVAEHRTGGLQWNRMQKAILPAFTFLAISVVILFAGATVANLRNKVNPVRALVLPTPIADVAPTPVLKQRLDSFWTQIDVAWEQENWESAIGALERLRELDPRSEEARKRLSQAYCKRGLKLVAASKLGEAQEEFDRAIRIDASSEELQDARHQLEMYLSGLEAYYAQEPEQVIESLEPLYEKNPHYRDTTAMLGQAHYEVGINDQEEGKWESARDHYKIALASLPDMPDAQKRLAEVEALITPPRRVVVDLSEQMMTIYQDNQPIHIFTVCTGRATAPTVPGRYEVLDKMPMAYASTWNLDMPWWVGIYWAGGSENGFHALPLRHGGNQVLWGSSLGRPCSFGCIVLDTDDAVTFYEWVEVGTVVFVNY